MNRQESATQTDPVKQSPAGLETVEVLTGPNPTAAVIWLHGLGADGHDFEPLVPQLTWEDAPDIRYVFPHAPTRPVTINGGMQMRAWYDIVSLTSGRDQDQQGIAVSVNQAAGLISHERQRGIAADRIIVAGFSQGGAIALQLALRYPEKLAGLIALSTYLLLEHRLESDANQANSKLPVFVGHGKADPMVPCQMGEAVARRLEQMGHPVEWHSYPMPHAVCPEEVDHLAIWLRDRLG
jgi:phospholipase/carboxylesterase